MHPYRLFQWISESHSISFMHCKGRVATHCTTKWNVLQPITSKRLNVHKTTFTFLCNSGWLVSPGVFLTLIVSHCSYFYISTSPPKSGRFYVTPSTDHIDILYTTPSQCTNKCIMFSEVKTLWGNQLYPSQHFGHLAAYYVLCLL